MCERLDHNFDDAGPKTYDDFEDRRIGLSKTERVWGVMQNGERIGAVMFQAATSRLGVLHVVFAKAASGSGASIVAGLIIANEIVEMGVEKVMAPMFLDNLLVYRFCQRLGFWEEAIFREHVLRNGMKTDIRVMAMTKDRWLSVKDKAVVHG